MFRLLKIFSHRKTNVIHNVNRRKNKLNNCVVSWIVCLPVFLFAHVLRAKFIIVFNKITANEEKEPYTCASARRIGIWIKFFFPIKQHNNIKLMYWLKVNIHTYTHPHTHVRCDLFRIETHARENESKDIEPKQKSKNYKLRVEITINLKIRF